MKKKLFWAANTYWTSPFQVGANHLAREFVKNDWDVFFTWEAVSLLNLLKRSDKKGVYDCLNLWRKGVGEDFNGKLKYCSPFNPFFVPQNYPFLRTKFVLDHWQDFTFPNIKRIARKADFAKVDLLIVDTVQQSFWLDHISARKKIFRLTDNFAGFKKATKHMLDKEREICKKVDLVIYTAKNLEEHVKSLNPKKALHVPNGVNVGNFLESNSEVPGEYLKISKPRVVYVGALDEWFDYDLMNYVSKQLPEVSFVIIGPEKMAKERLYESSNIHILGRRKYESIPAYLKNADVGIIPFNTRKYPKLVNSINPIKLYEYMACGLPVISVAFNEIMNIKSPAHLVTEKDEFVNKLKELLNSKSEKNKLINYAKDQDWSNRVKLILEEIL
jgi:glycosyltransferase involved in cell wall biosynthesis